MTSHVFIVDSTTFKYHLEYLFAGTGAKDYIIDFNSKPDTDLYYQRENTLISMIADASRVRKGDFIYFYLQQNSKTGITEGKFYGRFIAIEDWSFLENNHKSHYLKDELGKVLTFRTLISYNQVYSGGVTEWEALDEIRNIMSPNQMLWSLIYRKLKGNRGNTMITEYEAERLFQLIRNKNNKLPLSISKGISFNLSSQSIVLSETKTYDGFKTDIDLLPRLISKYSNRTAFEVHLQAFILKSIGKGINQSLDNCVLDDGNTQIDWIGNEVSCGVGMQRIDIMLSGVKNENKVVIPIELKAVEVQSKNVNQIQRYIDWLAQYYLPNCHSDIQPILITRSRKKQKLEDFRTIAKEFDGFNKRNSILCYPLKFIEYKLNDFGNNLIFTEVEY
jgi:hypothetical protein